VCYLKKTTPRLITLARQNWSMLGVFDMKKVAKDVPEVADLLRGKQVLQIPRRPIHHG
jgi:hypothetical protein